MTSIDGILRHNKMSVGLLKRVQCASMKSETDRSNEGTEKAEHAWPTGVYFVAHWGILRLYIQGEQRMQNRLGHSREQALENFLRELVAEERDWQTASPRRPRGSSG